METLTLDQILNNYCNELVTELRAQLEKNDRKASGNLINTLHANIVKTEDEASVVLHSEDYFKYINEGRQPTKSSSSTDKPLQERILQWIKEKNIVPQERNGILPTEKQLAYLITRKIHNEGYKGDNKVYSQAIERLNRKYEPLIQQALDKDLEKYVTVALNNIIK